MLVITNSMEAVRGEWDIRMKMIKYVENLEGVVRRRGKEETNVDDQ
jgi:hypothetical protein